LAKDPRSEQSRTKRLEAKNPIFYSVGVNTMTPFALPEQTENKNLGDPVETDMNRRALPRMSYRHKPEEALRGQLKEGIKKRKKKKKSAAGSREN
jgi:hypothetical protein